jgi:hypothetical protein
VRTIRELVEREDERLEKEFDRYCALRLSWYVIVSVDAIVVYRVRYYSRSVVN